MYQENENDWLIIKKYKQEKKNTLNNKITYIQKLNKKFKARKVKVTEELDALNARDISLLKVIESCKVYAEKKKKQRLLEDLNHDILSSENDIATFQTMVDALSAEIIEIENKIRELRSKKHAQEKANKSPQKKKEVVESCPKKCKVGTVTIACSHGRTMEVPPFEEGGDIPTLHVVSGSGKANKDIVTIKMAGSCDHGKKQTAEDNDKYQITQRLVGNDQFCPSTKIIGHNNDVNVHRPSGVQFNAATNLNIANTSPVYVLLKRLIFGNDNDTTEYDISFSSCKGNYPYKAKVVAHPKEVWDLKFNFGYKADYETKSSQRKFGQDERVKSYDAMLCNGNWSAGLEGSYTYDSVQSTPVKVTLTLEGLIEELKGSKWKYLAEIVEFFEPINGFFENAIGYSEGAAEHYNKTKNKADKNNKTIGIESSDASKLKATFEGPTIKIAGNYSMTERKESTTEIDGRQLTAPLYDVGGTGELSFGFDPLLKVTGTVDILQLLMCTLGEPLGSFLRKVSNMSMGKKDQYGNLDKTESYIETNLILQIGLTSSLAGNLVFDSTEERGWLKGWRASEKTSIGGFIGFILTGKASVDGQGKALGFTVKFGAGAEFKTTDESGGKEAGIEVNYKPTMIGNKFNWAGEFIFNGLSIVWVVYANAGVDGAEQDTDHNKTKKPGNKLKNIKAEAPKKELKESNKVDLFKKRALFANDDAGTVNA